MLLACPLTCFHDKFKTSDRQLLYSPSLFRRHLDQRQKISVAAKKNHECFFYALQGIGVFHVLREFSGTYCLIKKSLEKYFNNPWGREQGITSLDEFSTYLV